MERESFEDEEVSRLLNNSFVAVKVDREERPDIDAVYMAVCQALTESGGWPLTILMTPAKKPFWAGTYLPKRRRYGTLGLLELLQETARLWAVERERLIQAGDEIAAFAAKRDEAAAAEPEKELLRVAARQFAQSFDPQNGGFGRAPKFPTPHNLLFLLRYAELEGGETAREMALRTLDQMARGGLFDQVGGGFSRYSTDERWLVPHFEKMLYDNALLAYTYLEAVRITGSGFYREVAERTLSYLRRELSGPDGGFCCGQDADSDGEEGSYYLFTPKEVEQVLGREDGALFCRWYGVSEAGNFEGKSIPNLLLNKGYATPEPRLRDLCKKLRSYRSSRMPLHRDDKALTSWNALALAAFAKAYRVLGKQSDRDAAVSCRAFIQARLKRTDGRLFVRWRDGEAAHEGQLEDYAFYAWALLELYAAEYDVSCLAEALELAGWMERLFGDSENGGYYLYAADAEQLISRPKELYDGAMPSGNAAAALVLVRLAALTGEPEWQERADRQLAWVAGNIAGYPAGHCFSLLAVSEALYPTGELVCALSEKELPNGLQALLEKKRFAALVKTADNETALAECAPFTADYPLPETGAAYYLCRGGACREPVFTLSELESVTEFYSS